MEKAKSRVCVWTDAEGRITRIEGEYTLPDDLTGAVLLEEGAPCDRLNLAQSHYLEGGLLTEDGVCRWKLAGGAAVLRSAEELQADRDARPAAEPTPLEDMDTMLVDHEYRLTMLELGVE